MFTNLSSTNYQHLRLVSLKYEKTYSLKDDSKRSDFIKPNCCVKLHPNTEHFSPSDSNRDIPSFSPAVAYGLLEKCLDLNPFTRITASQALQHPFLYRYKQCTYVNWIYFLLIVT